MRIPLLAVLLCGALSAAAQFNFPFPTRNSVWTQYVDLYSTGCWPPTYYGRTYYSFYMAESDTVIDGRVYAQVFDHTDTYTAAVRDTAGKVLVVPEGSTLEFLLYDFTLPVGVDTIMEVWVLGSQQAWQFWMRGDGPTGEDGRVVILGEGYSWIEGIGCTAGLFKEPAINVSGSSAELYCMSTDDTQNYPLTAPGTCAITTTVPEQAQKEMSLYPNPTNDLLFVEFGSSANRSYSIGAMDGRIVQSGSVAGEHGTIGTSGLADGAYMIEVMDGKGSRRSTFVKRGP